MPVEYRESRSYVRDRDASPSSDEGYKKTTVRRYKVAPGRIEHEHEVDVIEDDRRSRYTTPARSQADLLEIDRRSERVYIPERPRSVIVERERDRERDVRDDRYTRVEYRGGSDDRSRSAVFEREKIQLVTTRDRDDDFYRDDDRDRSRVVYEKTKEVERDNLRSPRDWDRRSYWDDDRQAEVRIEKRVERRDDGTEVLVERRVEERREEEYPRDLEHYRKETEYYEPAPAAAPIIIRQRAPEQRIIVQEAPAPAPSPVLIREEIETRDVAVTSRPVRGDEEYYYRRESREVGPYRGDRFEEEVSIERYDDGHRRHHHHRHHDDAEVDGYYKKTTIRRERSESGSPHRKRHIAEGVLAGAGISALMASRRNDEGELPEHRGRKVLAGAVLGGIGTEVARRAHSAYQERYGDEDEERSRSRSRGGHSRIKTGLGIAAVALAAAGAAKYLKSQKEEKEELNRGRALRRYSDSEYSRSPSRKRSKSRASSLAKAAAGTAAVAGLVHHIRSKSKSRDGKSRSRSKSRIRTGAEIVAAGLAGAGAKKLYDRHKDKKERERSRSRHDRDYSETEDDYVRDEREYRRRSRSRSHSRSGPTHPAADSATADPELGMVEYGTAPLYPEPPYPEYGAGAAAAGYESAAEERRHRHRRGSDHRRSRSRGKDGYSGDSESDGGYDRKPEKKRSKSRIRDVAAGAVAAAAAGIGLKKYNDSMEKKKEKERDEKERSRDRRDRERERGRDRDRIRYEDETSPDGVDMYGRQTPSPPLASGGYYNPQAPQPAAQPAAPLNHTYYNPPTAAAAAPTAAAPPSTGFTQHPNVATDNLAAQQYPPYNPLDYATMPPPPPGPPPALGPEHVSVDSRVGPHSKSMPRSEEEKEEDAVYPRGHGEKDGVNHRLFSATPPPFSPAGEESEADTIHTTKSVAFIPLSPKSSQTLRRHREAQEAAKATPPSPASGGDDGDRGKGKAVDNADNDEQLVPYRPRRRRDSDPSSNRPRRSQQRLGGDAADDGNGESEDIETLPDRFDAQGRPIDRERPRWHARHGNFEYHRTNPFRARSEDGGFNMRGQWGVAGTDPEAVERIVRNVTGVLEGRESWMGLLSGLLS
ncbi:hypothetical protein B0T22DRAFT_415910, partial [Podospora appendiculata]